MKIKIFTVGFVCCALAACSGNDDQISTAAAPSPEASTELAWDVVDPGTGV